MKTFTIKCLAVATLVLCFSIALRGQTEFDTERLRVVQAEIASATEWQGTPVTPMQPSSKSMVITKWTSKSERGVVIVTLYNLESKQAAHAALEMHAVSFPARPMEGIGDETQVQVRRGEIAFRRGRVVATVKAVASKAVNRLKFDHEREIALCVRFAKAVDAGLKLVYPTSR